MGPDSRNATYTENGNTPYNASDLVYLPNAYYADPLFSWLTPIGVTSIQFLRSARFDSNLRDQAVVGESNNGQLYLFRLKSTRDDFDLTGALADRVADSATERNSLTWGTNWGIVTDLKIGPDGYLYVVSLFANRVYRIRPVNPPPILNGRALLDGRAGLPLGVPLRLTLLQNGTPVETITTQLDAYGQFSERIAASGTYTVRAKAGSYLSVSVPNITLGTSGFAYLALQFAVNGDVNGDDQIDDADLLSVLFDFGQSESPPDLNNDGTVDDADLLIVLFNFGSSG